MLYLKPSFSDIALLYPTEYRLAATITEHAKQMLLQEIEFFLVLFFDSKTLCKTYIFS